MDMTTLIAAAATAAGEAPAGDAYAAWRGRVLSIAADLAAMVSGYETREGRKKGAGFDADDKVTVFFAKLVSVKEITKGTGEKVVHKGQLVLEAHNSSNSDQNGHETIETAPLGSPEGDEEFARAKALVGQNVKIYKRNFLHPSDKSKKLKELVAVDPASGFSAAPPPPATPAVERTNEEAERVNEVREQLNHLDATDKNLFREHMQKSGRPLKSDQWTLGDLDAIESWLNGEAEES